MRWLQHQTDLTVASFRPEGHHSQELTLVVGYHRKVQRQCTSGYEQVVCANWLADLLQACSYHTLYGVDGRFES